MLFMESRIDKYYNNNETDYLTNDSMSRSNRNSRLYKQFYTSSGDFANLPIDDNTDEIDMERLKEIVNRNNLEPRREVKNFNDEELLSRKRKLDDQKIYDINKLLEKARYENSKLKEPEEKLFKPRGDILSTLESRELSVDEIKEACRKYENLDLKEAKPDNNDKNDDDYLGMTREMKYRTRQISTDPLVEQVIPEDNPSLDLLADLKPTGDTIVTEPIKDNDNSKAKDKKEEFKPKQLDKPFFQAKDNTSDIDVIKKEHEKDMDTDFFTSSYQFSKNDFADDDFYDDDKSHNILKILVLILAILVFIGVICYFVLNFGMGT